MKAIIPILLTDVNTTTDVPETDNPEWAIGTTYAAGDTVMIAAQHEEWESVAGGNVGNDPNTTDDRVSESPSWIYLGATNPWKMLSDEFVNSQTVTTDEIVVEITPGEIIDACAIFNIEAETVTIVMTDPVEGEVYRKVHSAIDMEVDDYYDYYFKPVRYIKTIVDLDLPPYPDAVTTITISYSGETVKAGAVVVGKLMSLGKTVWGPKIGRLSFSKTDRDEYGRVEFTKRPSAREVELDIIIENEFVDEVDSILSEMDAVGVAFIGDDVDYGITSMNGYGFFTDFSIVVPGPAVSECSITFEGFI